MHTESSAALDMLHPRKRVHDAKTRQPAWLTVSKDNRTVRRGWTHETGQGRGAAAGALMPQTTYQPGTCSGPCPTQKHASTIRKHASKPNRRSARTTTPSDVRGRATLPVDRRGDRCAHAPTTQRPGTCSGPCPTQKRASTAQKHASPRGRLSVKTLAPSDTRGRATLVKDSSR